MFKRMRLIILSMMGRGYPPIIFIEPGEDPTKDRQRMISPINTGRILTILIMLLALCPLSYAGSQVFFKPKVAAVMTPEGTQEATGEATMEATIEGTIEPTQEPSATPLVIIITATPEPTSTPTQTFTPTPTETPADVWQLWMTATQFEKDFFSQNQEATELPYWRVRIVTATATVQP